MATYQVRVEDKIGTIGDTQAISDWLTAGAKFVVNILPIQRLLKYTVNLTDAGSGISIVAYRFVSANKSGYGAREVSHNLSAQVVNSGSIHYAGTTDPVFYILNGLVYVKPSGGTVVAVAYPSVLFSDSTITSFPNDLDEIIVIYASMQGRLRQMSDLTITTLGGLSIDTIIRPTVPSTPSFTYTDATYSNAVYNPAIYVKALIDTISATTIAFTDTLVYNPPVFAGNYTNVDTALTNQDIELSNAHLSKVNAQLEEMQKDLLVSLNEFNRDKGEFDANLQIAISQAQLTQQRLAEQTRLQIELNKANEQQEVQTALANENQEAQIDAQNKAKAMELAIINESKELERQIQEYQAKLQIYGQEINAYSQEINQEISRVSQRINQYNAQFQQYAVGLEALRQEFQNHIKAI